MCRKVVSFTPCAAHVVRSFTSRVIQVAPSEWWRFTSLAIIFGAFGLGLRRRRSPYFMIVLLSSGVLLLSACGGGASGTSPHTPITAAVTVTGTSGSIQSSANLTVTYTP